ncbi:MAG: VacJ family lipoprotein [Desulfobacula sp.]|nr:VacJ family lipoprotein [Desulfobacula sp.]
MLARNTKPIPDENESVDELDDDFFDDDFDDTKQTQQIADPLYYFNYAMYSFNDFLYFAALKPIATGYKAITLTQFRKGMNNFFHNLLFPLRFVNNVLQGEILDAGTEINFFLINSTFGILGFGQVAQNKFDLHTFNEDLGQTLGSYSIGNGFYLVLPILGPSTLRDAVGFAGDYFLKPVNYVEPWELSLGLYTYDSINATSFRLGDYEALKEAALDPYDAYIQNRKEKIKE